MGEPNVRTLAVSHHVLEFEACSARPASTVLRWTLAGYSGLVVRRLSRGKYIILCQLPLILIGASLSEPHTSVTALEEVVCMYVPSLFK